MLKRLAPDLVTVAGVVTVGAGLWLVHPAAALVFAGLYLAATGVLLDKQAKAAAARKAPPPAREVP